MLHEFTALNKWAPIWSTFFVPIDPAIKHDESLLFRRKIMAGPRTVFGHRLGFGEERDK